MRTLTCRSAMLTLPLLPLALSCAGARAQQPASLTPEQSATLDRAVSLWTSGFGGTGKNSALPYTLTPEGDHYVLTMPLPKQMGTSGVSMSAADLVAHVHPLDGGRWAFDNVHGMTPFTLSTQAAQGGKQLRMSANVAAQDGQAMIDPALASSSSFDTKFGAVSVEIDSEGNSASIHAQGGATHSGWQPAAPGRVDVSRTTDIHDLVYDIAEPKKVTVRIKTLHGEAHMTGFDPSKMVSVTSLGLDMLRAFPEAAAGGIVAPASNSERGGTTKTAGTQQAAPPPPPPPAADAAPSSAGNPSKSAGTRQAAPPPSPSQAADIVAPTPGQTAHQTAHKPQLTAQQRLQLHQLIDDVRGLFASTDNTYMLTGIDVQAAGHDVTLAKAAFSQAIAAPDGKLDAHMRMAFEGLVSPDIPPAIAHDFLPHRLVIAPHVSGLPAGDVFDLISQAIDQDQPDKAAMQARAAALLGKGPVTAGFDELAFDLGPALFTASGSLKISGPAPKDLTGSAVIEAHGLSALIKRANTDPMVKQAAPVLIFLKGIGDEDDSGNVVWKVTYGDGKVLVNGTDLSQLVPHK